MDYKPEQVVQSLLSKIFKTITAGTDQLSSSDFAVSWVMPGIPFSFEDLDFNLYGFGSQQGLGDRKGREKADIVRERYISAENFANLVNAIPAAGEFIDDAKTQLIYSPKSESIDAVYDILLRFSEVAHQELTEDQQKKIDRFRKLLSETVEFEDIITGEKKTKVVDGKLKKAYLEYESHYRDALVSFNSLKLNALNSTDARAVQEFALNGKILRQKVNAAYDAWVSQGFKNEYQQIVAAIDSITRRNLEVYKKDLLTKFENAKITNPTSGTDFYQTTLYPATFLTENNWTKFTFNKEEVDKHENKISQSLETDVKARWGLFSGSNETNYSSKNSSLDLKEEKFKITFSLAQAPISRPWFSPEFVRSSGWRFSKNSPITLFSDGQTPPKGQFPFLSRSAVFIKDVTIESSSLAKALKESESKLDTKTKAGFGPISISANYNREESDSKLTTNVSEGAIEIKGMQLIGFVCEKNPVIPNTNPDISDFT
ncbi:hypothetical protein [Tenacibaculum maritimum]|uniref:hypothetical protein n=1 Tax=Tenacibaculum maritimum TaxID=107401 RepID=UPI0012E50D97|nr:hypothetical protein [Tenacibaculum maritimum]MCD9562828.1 hypothetical protein [Tenacibaculum maritimum]MCD9566218.1 hypothetical protein [Tenacibaculum maritimum]MCD9579560.1 hypothetical protein [Tenacibaculum maritimum]MCD9596969.1 hypothetical protein [Tenacibaculum maritimum]MCD9613940.1 hypothetical protein [Tenacibaculum maritimum]